MVSKSVTAVRVWACSSWSAPRIFGGSTVVFRGGGLSVRSSAASTAVVHGVLLVLWLAAFLVSSLLEYAPHASLWFPPAAITFAALLVLGARALPVLWVACFLATLLTDRLYGQGLSATALGGSGLVFALAHTGAYGLIALSLRRLAWEASPMTTLRKVTVVLVGGALASGLSALLGAWGLGLTGMMPMADVAGVLAPWWIGDYAGLVTLGPLAAVGLVHLCRRCGIDVPTGVQYFSKSHRSRTLTARSLMKLGALLLVSAAILAGAAQFRDQEPLLFLLFVSIIVQLWIVHTETELCALTGIALFSALIVVATPLLQLGDDALVLQFVLISLAANSYLGLAVPSLYSDNDRLRYLLTHDVLTGALSRAFFEERVRQGIDASRHRDEPAALMMIDLNGLKQINDRQGHSAGDAALTALVRACQGQLQAGEILGRLSGDEFAVFLPRSTSQRADRVVRAMKEALAGSPLPVAASFGVAELMAGESYEGLLHRADQVMYADKPGLA